MDSPEELIESLIVGVQNLVPDPLNNGQGKSLLVKLEGAIQKNDAGQTAVAINMLEVFITHVEAFVGAGILLPEEGDPLIVTAELALVFLSI